MDERKILIVNLSRGLVGEDNAALLGALLVTKIQLAAMSRADIDDVAKRVPFYLYVDEFQNFATDSFATILSEARKYGLCLTVANQYIAQMTQEVRDAVFGNVGSTIAFRMGADDARVMQHYFEPRFEEHDLVHMHNRNFVISLTIGGEKVQAFSGTSLNLPPQTEGSYYEAIVEHSRSEYARKVKDIEDYVQDRYIVPSQKAPTEPKKSSMATPTASPIETEPKAQKPERTKSTTEAIGSVVVPSLTTEEPVKKKRKRTRRRKKTAIESTVLAPTKAIEEPPQHEPAKLENVAPQTDGHIDGDGTIHLR